MSQLGTASDDLWHDHPEIRCRRLLFRDHRAVEGAPSRLDPIGDIDGWHVYEPSITEIDAILQRCIQDPCPPNSRRLL